MRNPTFTHMTVPIFVQINRLRILSNEERDDFNIEQWYRDVLTEVPRAQSVMVNDSNAIGVLGEPEQGKTSHLIFHDGRTQIELISAAYTLQELIQITSTL